MLPLTVAELAAALGQSERTTRQLLNHGLIPGARRVDPRAGRSPWLIPLDAPAKYLKTVLRPHQLTMARAKRHRTEHEGIHYRDLPTRRVYDIIY